MKEKTPLKLSCIALFATLFVTFFLTLALWQLEKASAFVILCISLGGLFLSIVLALIVFLVTARKEK